jgi:competence ComEA-like helix-hairpin-helix protein
MMADSEPQLTQRGREPAALQNSAGPYGFTRREIIVLSVLGCLVIAISIGQWLSRRNVAGLPQWHTERILVESQPPSRMTGSVASVPVGSDGPNRVRLDINSATHDDLLSLPGIGPVLATRIIDDRSQNGPFNNLVDLQRVRGIGPKKAAAIASLVRFSYPSASGDDTTGGVP